MMIRRRRRGGVSRARRHIRHGRRETLRGRGVGVDGHSVAFDPRMVHDTLQRQPLVGILSKQTADQVNSLGVHGDRALVLVVGDLLVGTVVGGRLEGRLADEKLVAEHAQRPEVDLLVVRSIVYHLRREVVERAADGCATRGGRMHRPAKVSDLKVTVDAEQQVLWLDVAVNDLFRVAIAQGVGQLIDVLYFRKIQS